MANLDHIKQEMFISKEDAPSHTEEETEEIINVSNKDEINSNHENTIVFQEEEETISVTRLPDDDAVEDQYNGLYSDEKGHVEADQVAQEVLPRYEEIFVQETPPLEDNTNNEQIVGYINHNIEDNNEENENHNGVIDYDNCEESDNDDYQIVEGLHITGDVEEENVIQTQEITHVHTDEQSLLKKDYFANSLNEAAINKDTKAVLFYVVRHPEKENLDSMSVLNSSLCKPLKTNPRSILKSSHMASQLPEEQTVQSERLGKRFARSKEAIEERLFMNFINKTTIPVEPIRNHRLPRKQKINPVKRMDDEEIIVQEVVVSSNGFVETLEDGVLKSKEPLKVTEVVTLTDSDDEYDPKQGKKKRRKHKRQKQKIPNDNSDSDDNSVIEILSDSDREVIEPTEGSASVSKRPRGRPKKVHIKTYKDDVKNNEIDTSPTLKRGRPRGFKILSKTQQSDSQDDSESPAKKSRTDDSEDSPKREVTCPDCLKSFASPNSLKTHLQHHSLENCLKNSEVEKTSEPEPDKINPVSNSTHSEAEVNSMLGENTDDNLEKDVENKESESLEESVDGIASVKGSPNADSKPPVVSSDPDSAESKTPTTLQKTKSKPGRSKLSVATRMSVNTKRFSRSTFDYKHKCTDCGAAFKNIILLNRHVCPKKPDSNKFECSICKKGFLDVNKLTTHKRSHIKDNIVKATNAVKVSPKRTRASVAVSTFKSPKKCSSHKCKDCGKICSSIILLNAHMKTHKQFTCTNCNVSFPSRILLDTHVRESCVKTKLPQSRRLSFKIKKAFSPSRTSARFSTKASNSRSSNASDLSDKPNTSIASASKTLQLQCDSCHMKFSSHAKLFDHKVLQHGLNTPDKKSILDRSRRKTLYRQRGTFGGVPASKKLTTAYAALKSKFDDLG